MALTISDIILDTKKIQSSSFEYYIFIKLIEYNTDVFHIYGNIQSRNLSEQIQERTFIVATIQPITTSISIFTKDKILLPMVVKFAKANKFNTSRDNNSASDNILNDILLADIL